ncbi:MAG: glycosyltransferase family 2 protein [Desulfococcaceae bacterium]|nr:glycosyltransferase family 2 protein [Desulfococcaceae bacterium]
MKDIKINLSIIIVNYNTKNLLQKCLRSVLENTTGISFEIIVVDNNSSDGSPDMVRRDFPHTLLICNNKNVGFSKANNMAFRQAAGEYLLFLNSDTLIGKSAVQKMLDYMKIHNKTGIIGPKILDPQYRPTPSYMRFLDVSKLFLGSKLLKNFIDIEKNRIHYPVYDFNSTQSVEWISGACMLVRRNIFEKAGLFDENYFLYFEDMDLCLQIKKLGYEIVYLPSAEIIHFFGASSSKKKNSIKKIFHHSQRHYFKKNFSDWHRAVVTLYQLLFSKFF